MKTVNLKRPFILIFALFYATGLLAAESGFQGLLIEPAKSLKLQSMINHEGQSIDFPQNNGHMKFVFFGYTSCPDICPMTLRKIKRLISKLGPTANDLEYYFVSIDPQRDEAKNLKQFVNYYDKKITGITGHPRAIKALENEFGILTRKFQGKSAFAYTLEHSVFIYLLDNQGQLRVMYPGNTTVKSIIKDVELLRGTIKSLL